MSNRKDIDKKSFNKKNNVLQKRKDFQYTWKEEFITKGKNFGDFIIRVPVEFNLFGKLKSHSKKIIYNLLNANSGLFLYNFTQYKFDKAIKKEDLIKYIDSLSKRKDSMEYRNSDTYLKEYYFYYDKKFDIWYYALNLNLLAERYVMWKTDNEGKDTKYIPFKHNIYKNLNPNNKKEIELIGKLSLYNRSKHTEYYFSDCTNSDKRKIYGVYKFYTDGLMLNNRDIKSLTPFVKIDKKGKGKRQRYLFNSMHLYLNYLTRKRIKK